MSTPDHKSIYLIIDQGTSSTKVFLFDNSGRVLFSRRRRHRLTRPAPLHVESNPLEILEVCHHLIDVALNFAARKGYRIAKAGMAVQRSTFLFWHKETLRPLTPAISWQDSRAKNIIDVFEKNAREIQEITGTPLSAHFGAPKFLHLVEHDKDLRRMVKAGDIWFGPLSAFLTHSFTGKAVLDHSIAGRSLLMNLDTAEWDPSLCALFDIPLHCLPPLVPTTGDFGTLSIDGNSLPLACVIGDQQAALIGQGGSEPGTLAMNFGTSGSVQYNSGSQPGHISGLISSVLISDNVSRTYMLEGTINACNSLFYWLETELDIPHHQMSWHDRCENTTTKGVLVPGFVGLAAPYWRDDFSTIRLQLDHATPDEIIRAGMESIGFLVYDIYSRIKDRFPLTAKLITAGGGGSRSPLLQFIADLLRLYVGHTTLKDRTALGVFKLLKAGSGHAPENLSVECDQVFKPQMDEMERQDKINLWHKALLQERISLTEP
ncbi:MAG: hypothetical protein GXO92_04305 [FCB group bacterium]|nr:hypothetical protein [FCB group bacterium]